MKSLSKISKPGSILQHNEQVENQNICGLDTYKDRILVGVLQEMGSVEEHLMHLNLQTT